MPSRFKVLLVDEDDTQDWDQSSAKKRSKSGAQKVSRVVLRLHSASKTGMTKKNMSRRPHQKAEAPLPNAGQEDENDGKDAAADHGENGYDELEKAKLKAAIRRVQAKLRQIQKNECTASQKKARKAHEAQGNAQQSGPVGDSAGSSEGNLGGLETVPKVVVEVHGTGP